MLPVSVAPPPPDSSLRFGMTDGFLSRSIWSKSISPRLAAWRNTKKSMLESPKAEKPKKGSVFLTARGGSDGIETDPAT